MCRDGVVDQRLMGISGPGTLANDLASAYLHRTVQGLCERIEGWFASGDASLDEEGESKLVPTQRSSKKSRKKKR